MLFSNCNPAEKEEKLIINPNDDLKTTLDKIVINEKIPGIVAAISDSSGIQVIEAAGVRKYESSELMTTDDKLHLGSCTKAMTSAMISTLVRDGQMNWEMTIKDVFPNLQDSINSAYHTATLLQLCTHRSGVAANATNWMDYQDLDIVETRQRIMLDNLKESSDIKSGDFLYSNLGYMIAGHMAEKVTGQTWETLMQERLFDPLGMSSAGFGPPSISKNLNEPWGHNKLIVTDWIPSQLDNPPALGPAGTVHCNMADWSTFVNSLLLHKTSSIFQQEQLETLLTPIDDYACGWNVLDRPWGKGKVYNHSGSNTTWLSVVWAAPELNRAYFVIVNAMDDNSAKICDDVIGKLIALDQD